MGPVVRSIRILPWIVALLFCVGAHADTINFEGLTDGTSVGSYYAGLTFTNATVLSAGVSLNELEFPPHSGQNVVLDDGGPIRINFALPVSAFSAYFTYASPLLISAFDGSGTLLGAVTSSFLANYTSSGNPPNELLSLAFGQGIASVLLAGDPAGGSFVMDDISYSVGGAVPPPPPPPVTTTPEPSAVVLLGTGVLIMLLLHQGPLTRVRRAN